MQLADFPRWLRGLFAVFLILFFFNALYALAFFTAIWGLRMDLGVAILIGAIAGLGIVGWQARLGFANLIRSQEHRAAIEMYARNQQQLLARQLEEQRIAEELRVLMAALRAEIVRLRAEINRLRAELGVSGKLPFAIRKFRKLQLPRTASISAIASSGSWSPRHAT